MFKMWKKVKSILREKKGATVVEVSYIIPLLLFLMAGIFLFSITLLDSAAAKGRTIYVATKKDTEKADSEQVPENTSLTLLNSGPYQIKVQPNDIMVQVKISGSLPWHGLQAYMPVTHESNIVTRKLKDCRKEWMWGAEVLK